MYGRTSPIDQTKMSDYRDDTHFQANPQTKQLRNLKTYPLHPKSELDKQKIHIECYSKIGYMRHFKIICCVF
jgi:hypothetical protein